MGSESFPWYVVQTSAQAERRVAKALRRLQYRAYVPQFRRDKQNPRTGRWTRSRRMLMPGYILVRLTRLCSDGLPDWMALHNTDGVLSVLGLSDGPRPVSRETVRQIMLAQRLGIFDDLRRMGKRARRKELEKQFPIGCKAHIRGGPFDDFVLTVTRVSHMMVTGNTRILGREVSITAEAERLERIGAKAKPRPTLEDHVVLAAG